MRGDTLSKMRRFVLVVAALSGGCDTVFGLDAEERPCDGSSFAAATPVDITAANMFSVSWDRSLVVFVTDGIAYERALPDGPPTPIDLGIYVDMALALTPEADALFFTAAIEPPVLMGALRSTAGAWSPAPVVPRGTFAGTPSADAFGPRRLLVRLRFGLPDVQEYEDDAGKWMPVGAPHAVDGGFAPNLTPNGLTMVYVNPAGELPGVYSASRPSTAEWFGPPVAILPGGHQQPQLLDKCKQLFVVDDDQVLRRYDQ